jgi:hypothetical protein
VWPTEPATNIILYAETDNVKQKIGIPTKKLVFRKGDLGGKKGVFGLKRAIVGNKEDGIR